MDEFSAGSNSTLASAPPDLGGARRSNLALQLAPWAGLWGIILVMRFYGPLDENLFYVIGIILSFLPLLATVFVHKRAARAVDVGSLVPVSTALALAPTLLALVLFVNGAMDHSSAETHSQVVIRKAISRGRYSDSYHVEYSSWRANKSFEERDIPYEVYRQFQVGDPIAIDIHEGALGIPWMEPIHKQ